MFVRLCVVKAVLLYQKVVVHFISMLISVLTFFLYHVESRLSPV